MVLFEALKYGYEVAIMVDPGFCILLLRYSHLILA